MKVLAAVTVVRGQTVTEVLRRGLRVRARCTAACRLKGVARRSGSVVARGKGSLARAGTTTLRLRFDRAARRRLRAARRLRLAVLIRARDAAGRAQTSARTVTIRRR